MAANSKKPRSKSRYQSSSPVNGNLARKLDSRELERRLERSGHLDFDKQYRRRQESDAERRARQRAQTKAAVRPAQKIAPLPVLGFVSVAVMLVLLLMCYIQINAVSRSIVSMKNQISLLEAEQLSLLTKYEQSFDLTSVKESAKAAGMSQPSESQIYYIDLPGEDQAVSRSSAKSGPLDGLFSAISEKIQTVLEYFS